ncbi:haloacid dehalogenase-like hydrolase [Litorivivens sp.]|uniref:haloacid dehalogenase-like hydrolase n=1 Tax=Litorivivens sp. TaxID=2020868 RepID=UPI00356AEE46
MESKTLVVDLCGTLVKTNTTHGLLLFREMPLLRRAVAHCLLSRPATIVLTRLSGDVQRRLLVRLLMGLAEFDLQAIARSYARSALQNLPRKEVLDRVVSHKQAGGELYLASASLDVVVSAFAELLNAEGYVATRLRYTGDYCQGVIERDSTGNKLAELRALPHFDGKDFEAITDNPEDEDLMQAAEKFWFIEND